MKIFRSYHLQVATLALALGHVHSFADTLDGILERGTEYSVLWTVSPESGDVIGQLFSNTSQAGQTILAHCLPDLYCIAEGSHLAESLEVLPPSVHFSMQPSGWWFIAHTRNAYMQSSLPLQEKELHTRYGTLGITDEQWLLFNGHPVMETSLAPEASADNATPSDGQESTAPGLLERIQAQLHSGWQTLRQRLLALLGRSDPAATTEAAPPPMGVTATSMPGDGLPIQGNNALHVVAHLEGQTHDIVLLQNTGGTACPALYRFATLTRQGIAVTPEFGTCSDITHLTLREPPGGALQPLLTMNGFLGPFEPENDRQRAYMQLQQFVLEDGHIRPLPTEH